MIDWTAPTTTTSGHEGTLEAAHAGGFFDAVPTA